MYTSGNVTYNSLYNVAGPRFNTLDVDVMKRINGFIGGMFLIIF